MIDLISHTKKITKLRLACCLHSYFSFKSPKRENKVKILFILMLTIGLSGCAISNQSRSESAKEALALYPVCESNYPITLNSAKYSAWIIAMNQADYGNCEVIANQSGEPYRGSAVYRVMVQYCYDAKNKEPYTSWKPKTKHYKDLTSSEVNCIKHQISNWKNEAVKLQAPFIKQEIEKEELRIKKESDLQSKNRKKWESSDEGKATKQACYIVGIEIAQNRSFNSVKVVAFDGTLNGKQPIQCQIEASGVDITGGLRIEDIGFIYNRDTNMYQVY